MALIALSLVKAHLCHRRRLRQGLELVVHVRHAHRRLLRLKVQLPRRDLRLTRVSQRLRCVWCVFVLCVSSVTVCCASRSSAAATHCVTRASGSACRWTF